MSGINSFVHFSPLKTTVSRKVSTFSDIRPRILYWKEKQKPAARTPNVVFVVGSHYHSLQIIVLLLQACLFGSLALSRTLLMQQLQWLQQDRRFRSTLYASLFSCCLKTDSVARCLRER